ncbi:MAG: H-NS histone family protein [Halochromatium sp.]
MNDEYRSAEEIQAHLEQLRQDQAALEQALKDRRKEEKKELAAEIKNMIIERGHDVFEIAELLLGGQKKRRRTAANSASSGYTLYADPDNPERVYSRGRMPQWLIDKMAANGFDPSDAQQRQQFKEQHLTPLAA